MTPEDVAEGRRLYETAKAAIYAHLPPTAEQRARGADMRGFNPAENPHVPQDTGYDFAIKALAGLHRLRNWAEKHIEDLISAAETVYWAEKHIEDLISAAETVYEIERAVPPAQDVSVPATVVCRFKGCDKPATMRVTIRLPAQLDDTTFLAEDQREQPIDLCDEHGSIVYSVSGATAVSLLKKDAPDRSRVWYGLCEYWTDDWSKLKDTTGDGRGIPCCPVCGAVGFEQSAADWWRQVDEYEVLMGHPGYRKQIEDAKERCDRARRPISL